MTATTNAQGLEPDLGFVMRWSIADAFSLRLDAHAALPGGRLVPLYHLIDEEAFGLSFTLPASFLNTGAFSYTGFGLGTVASVTGGPVSATASIDFSWYRTIASGNGLPIDRAAYGARPGAQIDVALAEQLRAGFMIEAQLFTADRGVLIATMILSTEI